jgi:hypothetical protein
MPKPKPAKPAPSTLAVRDTAQQLDNVVEKFRELDEAVRNYVANAMKSAVSSGLYIMKIRALRCTGGTRTQFGADTCPPQAQNDSDQDFYTYLEKEFCRGKAECDTDEEHRRHVDSTLRRFRRYMNAARYFGLNGDHTLEDVERLEVSGAFASLTLTDIYKPKELPDATPEQRPKPSVHATVSASLSQLCSEILTLKDDCPPDFYDANHTLLKSTLEAYTGTEWFSAGTANQGEHGELHQPNGSKRKTAKAAKRRKLSPEDRDRIAAAQRARWAASRAKK